MSMTSQQITLAAATAKKIVDGKNIAASQSPAQLYISEGTTDIFIGGIDVNATTGTKVVATTGTLSLLIGANDDVYAFSTAGGTVKVLSCKGGLTTSGAQPASG